MRIALSLLLLFLYVPIQAQVCPLFPCQKNIESPYGVCTHITRPGWDYEILDDELRICQQNEIRWIRSDLDFGNYFGSLTEHDPSLFDHVVSSLEQYDRQFLGILTWFGQMPWDDPDYAGYVSQLARQYQGRIHYWEALNEVNLMPEKDSLPEKYVRTLRTTYEALKQQDTTNVVLTSGFAEVRLDFLARLFQLDASQYFDIFNFHSYLPPESLVPCFHALHRLMSEYHWHKPVWITECGFHTARERKNTAQFYHKMLPDAIQRIGIDHNQVEIGILRDYDSGYNALTDEECSDWLWWNKHIRTISFRELQHLSPSRTPILVTAKDEYFPSIALPSLLRYVRQGGTIILSGGLPFYYDASLEGESMLTNKETGMKCYKSFHLAYEPGEECPREAGATPFNRSTYIWHPDKDSPARYLTDANLQTGDSLIPYITAGNDPNHRLPIAGIYKFHSELKGNIIFQTRLYSRTFPNREKEQAQRVARLYLTVSANRYHYSAAIGTIIADESVPP